MTLAKKFGTMPMAPNRAPRMALLLELPAPVDRGATCREVETRPNFLGRKQNTCVHYGIFRVSQGMRRSSTSNGRRADESPPSDWCQTYARMRCVTTHRFVASRARLDRLGHGSAASATHDSCDDRAAHPR